MKELLFLLLFAPAAFEQMRPVNTFSVVARDLLWAEAGVGAVATQSFVDPRRAASFAR